MRILQNKALAACKKAKLRRTSGVETPKERTRVTAGVKTRPSAGLNFLALRLEGPGRGGGAGERGGSGRAVGWGFV